MNTQTDNMYPPGGDVDEILNPIVVDQTAPNYSVRRIKIPGLLIQWGRDYDRRAFELRFSLKELWPVAVIVLAVLFFRLLPGLVANGPVSATFSPTGFTFETDPMPGQAQGEQETGAPASDSVPDHSPALQPAPTQSPIVRLEADAFLRAWPCPDCAVVQRYLSGHECEMLDPFPTEGWYHVTCGVEENEGWIWHENLSFPEP